MTYVDIFAHHCGEEITGSAAQRQRSIAIKALPSFRPPQSKSNPRSSEWLGQEGSILEHATHRDLLDALECLGQEREKVTASLDDVLLRAPESDALLIENLRVEATAMVRGEGT